MVSKFYDCRAYDSDVTGTCKDFSDELYFTLSSCTHKSRVSLLQNESLENYMRVCFFGVSKIYFFNEQRINQVDGKPQTLKAVLLLHQILFDARYVFVLKLVTAFARSPSSKYGMKRTIGKYGMKTVAVLSHSLLRDAMSCAAVVSVVCSGA